MNLDAVRAAPGVAAVLDADDIPGTNNFGPIADDDPVLAPGLVEYAGQAIFAVAADTVDNARKAALQADIEYEDLPAILDIREAIAQESFVLPTETIERGDAAKAIASASHRMKRSLELGGQDQFYLEGQIAMAQPREDGDLYVYSSTQHPGEVQHLVAAAIGRQAKDVVVECRRMGGGFGGKETQPALIACIAGLMAWKTGRPCKLRLDRDVDMLMTGKRHDFVIDYEVGFGDDGQIEGIEFMFASRCGMSADLSGSINDRTMFHCDNAYYLPNVKIISHRCKTHTVSNTAFRGFGGPQGMFAIECVIDDIARYLKIDALDVRRVNFYGSDSRNVTQYGQTVDDNIIDDIVDKLEQSSSYRERVAEIRAFQSRERRPQAGHLADARQVRHFFHGDAPEPGGRTGACLRGRHCAPESWRHRDGAGSVYQGRAGCCPRNSRLISTASRSRHRIRARYRMPLQPLHRPGRT